jgi:NADH-quinone oxidoreductase subunit A
MINYLPILIYAILAMLFAALSFIASGILAPKRKTEAKLAPYECGILPTKEPAERFPVRFYLVAMIFIVFDIEVIFVFPFALVAKQLALFGVIEIAVFALSVVIPFGYLLSHGALDWGPVKKMMPQTSNSSRTTESTVQRISFDTEGKLITRSEEENKGGTAA